MSKNRVNIGQSEETPDQSKAGVIRQAFAEIEAWREAGISMARIAQKLAERSSQDISVADVYRETYRARRRRKKKDAMTAAPYSTSTLVPRAQLPVTPAPSDDSLAARLKQRETKPLEFNPKPDADDLI